MSALLWRSGWDRRWTGSGFNPGMQSSCQHFSCGFAYKDFVLVQQKSRISQIHNFVFRSIFCILIIEHQEQIASGGIYFQQLLEGPKQRNPYASRKTVQGKEYQQTANLCAIPTEGRWRWGMRGFVPPLEPTAAHTARPPIFLSMQCCQ